MQTSDCMPGHLIWLWCLTPLMHLWLNGWNAFPGVYHKLLSVAVFEVFAFQSSLQKVKCVFKWVSCRPLYCCMMRFLTIVLDVVFCKFADRMSLQTLQMFILMMSGCILWYGLQISALSLLWIMDCNTIIHVLWRLLVVSLTVVFFFFHRSHNVLAINCSCFPWLTLSDVCVTLFFFFFCLDNSTNT